MSLKTVIVFDHVEITFLMRLTVDLFCRGNVKCYHLTIIDLQVPFLEVKSFCGHPALEGWGEVVWDSCSDQTTTKTPPLFLCLRLCKKDCGICEMNRTANFYCGLFKKWPRPVQWLTGTTKCEGLGHASKPPPRSIERNDSGGPGLV